MNQLKFAQLAPESTLVELATYEFQVELTTPGQVILEMFHQQPQLPGGIVTAAGKIVTMLSQRAFLEHMSKPYSLELYRQRPLQALLNVLKPQFLQLPASCTVVQATQIALGRTTNFIYEPIVVVLADEQLRVLDVQVLLEAQARILTTVNFLWQQQQQQSQAYLQLVEFQRDELQQKQLQLQKSEQRYRHLVELSPEMIAVVAAGKFEYINLAGVELIGADSELTVIGKPVQDFICAQEQEFEQQRLVQSSKKQKAVVKTQLRRVDGQLVNVEVTSIAVTYSNEPALQLIVRDLTEHQRRQEAQLQLQVAEATKQELAKALSQQQQLNKLKSRFISTASHEFRTPLTTILSSAELLQDYADQWTLQKKTQHLSRIVATVKQMTELLSDLLYVAQAEAGKLKFQPTSIDLVDFCRKLVDDLQMTTEKHNIVFNSPADLSAVMMDEKLLRQILSNLLSNAIKYSPDGGEVSLTVIAESDAVVFCIQDSGIGVPQLEQDKLFDSFHRASNVGTISGTGLGLAIVKQAVDLHRGRITVESSLGHGTTFTMTLPCSC